MRSTVKRLFALPALAFSTPALAHTGHIGESAGHSHWLVIAALAVAGAVGWTALARGASRRRRAISE